ncbi:hypothetical protein K6650_004393 [Vibrio vulnificus]|nr:hypothetical protein [Vibrio vulnificus]
MTGIIGAMAIVTWGKPQFFLDDIANKISRVCYVLIFAFLMWGTAIHVAASAPIDLLDEATYKLIEQSIKSKDVPSTWLYFTVAVLVWNCALEWLAERRIEHDRKNA